MKSDDRPAHVSFGAVLPPLVGRGRGARIAAGATSIVRRRWKLISIVAALIGTAYSLFHRAHPPVYLASVRVEIRVENQADASERRAFIGGKIAAAMKHLDDAATRAGNVKILATEEGAMVNCRGLEADAAANGANAAANELIGLVASAPALSSAPTAILADSKRLKQDIASADAALATLSKRRQLLAAVAAAPPTDAQRAEVMSATLTRIFRAEARNADLHSDRQTALADEKRLEALAADDRKEPPPPSPAKLAEVRKADAIYQSAAGEQASASDALLAQIALGKTDEHRDVIVARSRLEYAKAAVTEREGQLRAILREAAKSERRQSLESAARDARDRAVELECESANCKQNIEMLRGQLEAQKQADLEARQSVREMDELDSQLKAAGAAREELAIALTNCKAPSLAPSVKARLLAPARPPDAQISNAPVVLLASFALSAVVLGVLAALMMEAIGWIAWDRWRPTRWWAVRN